MPEPSAPLPDNALPIDSVLQDKAQELLMQLLLQFPELRSAALVLDWPEKFRTVFPGSVLAGQKPATLSVLELFGLAKSATTLIERLHLEGLRILQSMEDLAVQRARQEVAAAGARPVS